MSDADQQMAARLRRARAKHFPTAKAAADAMGIDYPTYAGHENGSRGFSKRVARYARFFKVRTAWLLSGQGDSTHDPLTDIYDSLPRPAQEEALRYLESLRRLHTK